MTAIVGLRWDFYTPQVEGQITRDLIALKSQPSGRNLMVVADDNPQLASLLNSLQIKRTPAFALAELWIAYQSGPDEVEVPEHATQVVKRDMQVKVAAPNIDTGEHAGFYMRPQGRAYAPTMTLNRPMPAHTPASTPPYITYLWGTKKS